MLKQLVDGKEIIQYRFVQSVTLSGGSSLTIWASGDLNDETVERLNCSAEHIVWKDLRSWNAGEHCTTVFAKPSGEALSWVTGPLLDPVQRTSLSLERPNQVQRTDSLSTTNWRSDGREARRASRSYYSHLRTPRNSLEPQTCPVIKRQYSGKVRVDEVIISQRCCLNQISTVHRFFIVPGFTVFFLGDVFQDLLLFV